MSSKRIPQNTQSRKLTLEQATRVKEEHWWYGTSISVLAFEYKVNPSAISRIINGVRYRESSGPIGPCCQLGDLYTKSTKGGP